MKKCNHLFVVKGKLTKKYCRNCGECQEINSPKISMDLVEYILENEGEDYGI